MENKDMTVNNVVYTVIKLLGKGKGGYSYLVTDGEKEYVLKQIHHEPCDYYQFGNKLESELRDYEILKRVGIRLPELFEVDEANERILKEYIDGPVVSELVAAKQMKPEYIADVEQMCSLLYPAGLNIDYYPTNFVVRENKLWYIDYECNKYDAKWDFEHWGKQYWEI